MGNTGVSHGLYWSVTRMIMERHMGDTGVLQG